MRRAFTLVELLVVFSVIVLLIALLLPTLSSARDSAERVREVSNSASLIKACLAFAVDRDGFIPNGQRYAAYNMTWANKAQWYILVDEYGLPFEEDTGFFGCASWADLNSSPFYEDRGNGNWKAPWIYWGGFKNTPKYKFIHTIDDAPTATSTTLMTCYHNRQPNGTRWGSYAPHISQGGNRGIVHKSRALFQETPPAEMCIGDIDGSVYWHPFADMKSFKQGFASTFWYVP